MAKDSQGGPISPESIAYLDEVKKGKPRKFAMICKGASVVSLVVYKKGNVEGRKKEAKEAGKGQFYFGVVDGAGVALRFMLARSDGFDSEPVKTSVLKGFLDESAGIKCKPVFEIVDSSAPVLDEDDPVVGRFLKLKAASKAVCDSYPDHASEINALLDEIPRLLEQESTEDALQKIAAIDDYLKSLSGSDSLESPVTAAPSPVSASAQPAPTASPVANDAAARFMARLKNLKPTIDIAIAAPGANPDIKVRLSEAAGLARNKEFEQAEQCLDQIELLIKQSGAEVTAPSVDASAQFVARLKSIKPSIDAAIALPGANPDIKLQLSEAALFARKKEFDRANQLLDSIEKLLQPAGATPSNLVAGDLAAKFTARFKALKPELDMVLAAGTPSSLEIKPLAVKVVGLAREKDFEQALAELAVLEKAISEARMQSVASSQSTGGTLEVALAQWTAARSKVLVDLKGIEQGIRAMKDPEGDAAIILLKAIQANLSARPDTLQAVAELERYISTDQIVEEAEAPNGFGIRPDIRGALPKALRAIRDALSV